MLQIRNNILVLVFLTLGFSFVVSAEEDSFILGEKALKKGEFQKSHTHFMKAVLTRPTEGKPILCLGHSFFVFKQYKDAEYCFRKGIDFIEDPNFQIDLRQNFPTQNQFLEKRRDLEKAYQQQPSSLRLQTVLGYVYFFSGEREQAKLIFHNITQTHPKDEFARFFIDRINREDKARFLKRVMVGKIKKGKGKEAKDVELSTNEWKEKNQQ